MRKLIAAAAAGVLAAFCTGCSGAPAESAQTLEQSDPGESVIDAAALDIDGDGTTEACTMTFGPTSGLFTVVITASAGDTVKYKNAFNLNYVYDLRFAEQDGVPQIYMERVSYGAGVQKPTAEYHKLYIEEGSRIVIDSLNENEGCWGDSEWNLDMQDNNENEL